MKTWRIIAKLSNQPPRLSRFFFHSHILFQNYCDRFILPVPGTPIVLLQLAFFHVLNLSTKCLSNDQRPRMNTGSRRNLSIHSKRWTVNSQKPTILFVSYSMLLGRFINFVQTWGCTRINAKQRWEQTVYWKRQQLLMQNVLSSSNFTHCLCWREPLAGRKDMENDYLIGVSEGQTANYWVQLIEKTWKSLNLEWTWQKISSESQQNFL